MDVRRIGPPSPLPVSYVVQQVGTDYEARPQVGSSLPSFRGMDVATTIRNALNGLTSGRNWREKVVLKAPALSITSQITVPAFTILEVQGRLSIDIPSVSAFKITGQQVDFEGGYWHNLNTGAGQGTIEFASGASQGRILNASFQGGRYAVDVGVPDVEIGQCYFTGCNNGVSSRAANRLSVHDSTFINSLDNAIDCAGTQLSFDTLTIRDTQAVPTTLNGIYIAGEGSDVTISNLTARGLYGSAVKIDNMTTAPRRIIIGDFNVFDCGKGGTGDDGISIVGDAVRSIKVVEIGPGTVEQSGQNGVKLLNVQRAIIAGVLSLNNGQKAIANQKAGIRLDTVTGAKIEANDSYDDQGTKTQQYGIQETGTSDNNLILGNDCRGNNDATLDIVYVGANNKVAYNLGRYTQQGAA